VSVRTLEDPITEVGHLDGDAERVDGVAGLVKLLASFGIVLERLSDLALDVGVELAVHCCVDE
jgi:hypothetical protein